MNLTQIDAKIKMLDILYNYINTVSRVCEKVSTHNVKNNQWETCLCETVNLLIIIIKNITTSN